jgi:ketosteroid isomerase-like protein
MSSVQEHNISVVLKYFDGCNTGNLEELLSTLDPDVIHYFLPEQFKPIRGAQHLAKYWRKFKNVLNPIWKIDHIIAQDDEVVSEWSCFWTPERTDLRLMMRGSEWYVMREGRIVEVRAYLAYSDKFNTELSGFPYSDRGYLT